MKTNLSSLEVGKVYRAKLEKSADIPNEKLIATRFLIETTGARPIQIYSYKNKWPRSTMLNWYQGKYKVALDHSDELIGTYWYIWRCPDNPDYLEVIKRSGDNSEHDSHDTDVDEWGFPINPPDDEVPF